MRWRQTDAAQKTCAARIRRQRQSELKKVDFDVPYLLLAPRQPWEPCGQACSLQAVHWLPEGLADYNPRSASPSDVWANDIVYHDPPAQGHGKKGNNSLFPVKRHRSDPKATAAVPFQGGSSCFGASWRFFLSSLCKNLHNELSLSLAQAGTYPHGWYALFKLQGERFSPFTL